jgi:hypothetical protein
MEHLSSAVEHQDQPHYSGEEIKHKSFAARIQPKRDIAYTASWASYSK